MHRKILVLVILSIIIFSFTGVIYGLLLPNKTTDETVSTVSVTNTLKLSGQLYEMVIHHFDGSTTTAPILHIGKPLALPEQYHSEPIEYIQLIVQSNYDWKKMIGAHVFAEGILNGNLEEGKSQATVLRLDTLDLKEDFDASLKDPVLNEDDIVGMVAENARVCGVGAGVTFFLPSNKSIYLRLGSEPAATHVDFGTWSIEGLSSEYKYPFKTEYGNSWSDGYAGPGFYSECARTLHSSVDSLHDLSLKTIDKYFKELSPEVQSEIREYYPTLR